MGGFIRSMTKPKVDTTASEKATVMASQEEEKAKKAEAQTAADEEYRRTRQRGRAATVLTNTPPVDSTMRSLLGG
jgi:hypothetical protein